MVLAPRVLLIIAGLISSVRAPARAAGFYVPGCEPVSEAPFHALVAVALRIVSA